MLGRYFLIITNKPLYNELFCIAFANRILLFRFPSFANGQILKISEYFLTYVTISDLAYNFHSTAQLQLNRPLFLINK